MHIHITKDFKSKETNYKYFLSAMRNANESLFSLHEPYIIFYLSIQKPVFVYKHTYLKPLDQNKGKLNANT